MISIDRLRINLPGGFERRGRTIARMVAGELARHDPGISLRLGHLRVPPLRIDPKQPDRAVARTIAGAIVGQIRHNSGE